MVGRTALATIVPLLVVTSQLWRFLEYRAIKVMLEARPKPDDPLPTEEEQLELEDLDLGTQMYSEPDVELSLARAIRVFAANDKAKIEFRSHNGFETLMSLSQSSEPDIQEEVAWAIGVLASDPDTETYLAEIGAIDILFHYTKVASDQVARRAQWSLGMLTSKAVHYNDILKQRSGKEGNIKTIDSFHVDGPSTPLASGNTVAASFNRLKSGSICVNDKDAAENYVNQSQAQTLKSNIKKVRP